MSKYPVRRQLERLDGCRLLAGCSQTVNALEEIPELMKDHKYSLSVYGSSVWLKAFSRKLCVHYKLEAKL